VKRAAWMLAYALACVVEFAATWVKELASKAIKGEPTTPPEAP
jgi:hypothetical protein